jgi:hypothetical protein
VIQEVIDRPGWQSGNSLTLFMVGEDQGASLLDNARDFESFENIEDPDDGGDGLHHPERIPTLKIFYGGAIGASDRNATIELTAVPVSVYPNPVENGLLHISSEGTGTMRVEIYDITGQLVKNTLTESDLVSMDVSDLSQGFYLVRSTRNGTSHTQKVIIK